MRSKEPGKIKIKLTEMLQDVGISVSPYDLWVQEGAYRSWDLARWGGYHATYQNRQFNLTSWDTMTMCVKNGIIISKFDHTLIEIHAKEPSQQLQLQQQ